MLFNTLEYFDLLFSKQSSIHNVVLFPHGEDL